MNIRKLTSLIGLCALSAVLVVAFNNCGNPKKSDENEKISNSILSDEPCENELMNFYARSYQPFLVENCASCHAKGPGKGQFASPDTSVAFKDFMQVGYSKVSSNAISESHNAPYTGTKHTLVVNDLKITWIKALSEHDICLGGDGEVESNLTLSERAHFGLPGKRVPTLNDGQQLPLEFNLTNELVALKDKPKPSTPSARFQVMVHKVLRGTERYYSVHSPRIYYPAGTNNGMDLRVKGIFIKINGRYINYSTNFKFSDSKVPKNILVTDSKSLLSTGAVVIAGAIFPEDEISVDFELVENTTIDPDIPPSKLSVIGEQIKVVPSGASEVEFTVRLDKPAEDLSTVTFTVDSSTQTGCTAGTFTVNGTCQSDVNTVFCAGGRCDNALNRNFQMARSILGSEFNVFNWDYILQSSSLTFEKGEQEKTFKVRTSKDIRYETTNRLMIITFEKGFGPIDIATTNNTAKAVFEKRSNPQPTMGEVTFTQLMSTGGVLFQRCTECHNSQRREGGYDIQDYELMVDNQVLKPGQDSITFDGDGNVVGRTANSLMYIRTRSELVGPAKLMPRAGSLVSPEMTKLENWLTRGAKNN